MYLVSRELKQFSAAHRLNKGYRGKCQHLHGHNYTVRITLSASQLNEFDFVMDFDVIKKLFDSWVQEHWDHVTLVSEQDVVLLQFLRAENQRFFIIPGEANTTAEVLAHYLFVQFNKILEGEALLGFDSSSLTLIQIDVLESARSQASYSLHSEKMKRQNDVTFSTGEILALRRENQS